MRSRSPRAGLTLIELLVFSAIFAVIIGAFITIFIAITNVQARQTASGEASQQGQFLLQQIQYYVSSARLVDMPIDTATGTLMLRESSSSIDPTIISLASGTVYLQQGSSGTLQALTSPRVTISNLSFTRHFGTATTSTSPYGIDSVSFSFTVNDKNSIQTAQQVSFQSSASVNAPVPKIAMIEQVKQESGNVSVSTLSATYARINEAGDLLIAVVGNKGSVSVGVSDTAGNTWTRVATGYDAGSTDQVNVYAAPNAIAATDTVTFTFGSGASDGAAFLYEYRGAATSSSFDAQSVSSTVASSVPSSGYANATSGVELLFGGTLNLSSTEVPSAGSGYILETSSNASYAMHLFVEDQNQYVANAVASTWQYSGTPDSLTFIATFQ